MSLGVWATHTLPRTGNELSANATWSILTDFEAFSQRAFWKMTLVEPLNSKENEMFVYLLCLNNADVGVFGV